MSYSRFSSSNWYTYGTSLTEPGELVLAIVPGTPDGDTLYVTHAKLTSRAGRRGVLKMVAVGFKAVYGRPPSKGEIAELCGYMDTFIDDDTEPVEA